MKFKLSIKKGLIYCLIAMLAFDYPTIALDRSAFALDSPTVADTTTSTPVTQVATTETTPAPVPTTTDSTSPVATTPDTTTAPTPDTTAAPTTATTSDPTAPSTPATSTANTIDTTTTSTAQSGNAAVTDNVTAGNAATGNASATDTILNNINSSTGGGMVNFTSNVTGDVTGDIQLYPMIVGALSSSGVVATPTTTPAVTSTTNNQIKNTISLSAASGTATVSGNVTAGNATTGNANTVANVVNIVNSIISTNKSFVGVINIYGNLNGDILIAPDFIPQLLASNAAASSGASATDIVNNTQIINNINLSATSGVAAVTDNVNAGNATSGSAQTNLVLINLSGHQVIASNSLLVFVNVLGKWVGVIVDAPAGSTAAAIGSDVTQNNVEAMLPAITSTTNSVITNNITLNSQTGNASVTHNVNAGNATTGNATASANVLNMSESNFGLSGWFGIIFINVFGSWLGSFGIDTGNGTIPLPTNPPSITQAPTVSPVVHKFTPKLAAVYATSSVVSAVDPSPTTDNTMAIPAVLGVQNTPDSPTSQPYNYTLAAFIALAILAVVIRRIWLAVVARRNLV